MSESVKCGPRTVLRPASPNWQLADESPPVQAPVVGSTTETKASGIEPLPGSGDGDAGVRGFLIERLAGNAARKLRSVGLKDAVAVRRVGLAEDGERKAGVKERGFRERPAAEESAQQKTRCDAKGIW